jgi:hypothetical protein
MVFDLTELKARADENGVIVGEVAFTANELIHDDFEALLDEMSERLTGTITLTDIDFQPVRVDDEHRVVLLVSGNITDIVDSYENELKDYA